MRIKEFSVFPGISKSFFSKNAVIFPKAITKQHPIREVRLLESNEKLLLQVKCSNLIIIKILVELLLDILICYNKIVFDYGG